MRVEIDLNATLKQYAPAGEKKFILEVSQEQCTIEKILAELRIPGNSGVLAVKDNKIVSLTTLLNEGDKLSFFSPLVGG